MQGISGSTNKCLLDLGGKPVIEYNLDRAADIDDVTEIVIVVGHRAEDIINRYGTSYRGKKIRYVLQSEQRGLVHAIECSKDALGKDDFFILLGDEVMTNTKHREMFKAFKEEGLFGICGVTFQEDKDKIGKTYTVIVDDNNKVYRLIEKPKKALNNFQGTGHCMFKNDILSFIERTPIHPERGERELPDLIQCTIDDGQVVKIFTICDRYTNINSEEDLEETKSMLNEL